MADDMITQQTEPAQTGPKYGVMIGAGLVLAVLILGGLFFWGKTVTDSQELNVEDAQPSFEVMTSHVEEPNIEFEDLPEIPEDVEVIEELEEDTFQ